MNICLRCCLLITKSIPRLVIQERQLLGLRISSYSSVKPSTMKIDSVEFRSLFTPELTSLTQLFKKYGYEIRIAGGAVRDLLMSKTPKDLDFATTATPTEMKEMFETENIRMINAKGEKHGTITPRINESQNFEITTLRIDVLTDGRHAEVQFTKDWFLDANRRDLTINSMFLGLDGVVYDYFNGIEDIKDRKIAFVGNPDHRIREDYLRILRYFRFYGRVSPSPDLHEESTMKAIQKNVSGLERISGERLWTELRQILSGNYAAQLLLAMLDLGIGPYIGLPDVVNRTELKAVWQRSITNQQPVHPMTLLASLVKNIDEMVEIHSRLKLSAYERDLGLFVVMHREDKPSEQPLKPYQSLLILTKAKVNDCREWIAQVFYYRGEYELAKKFKEWEVPKFMIGGKVLKHNGVPGGKTMGLVLQQLKSEWIEHDFKLSEEQLVKRVPHILDSLENVKKSPQRNK